MLTESMRRAGWRECPSDEVRRAWEEKGGRWQAVWNDGGEGGDHSNPWTARSLSMMPTVANRPRGTLPMCMEFGIWRPVSTQTWDYDPRGWGDVVGPESKQWGEWWWWQGEGLPLQAVKAMRCDDGDFLVVINGIDMYLSELGGRFIAPCAKPEVVG